MNLSPMRIFEKAREAVPELRWILGVLGIVAAIAIARKLVPDPRFAVFGTLGALALAVTLFVFAKLVGNKDEVPLARHVMLWSFLLVAILTLILLFTSFFFGKPLDLRHWITSEPATYEYTIHVTPEGAEIYLDGGLKGETRLSISLTRGDHEIQVKKPGFVSKTHHLTVPEDDTEVLISLIRQ